MPCKPSLSIHVHGYAIGLMTNSCTGFQDIRRRPSPTRLIEAWALPGSALSTIDLQRWVDSGSRPIQQERCSRPPKPHPHRQSQGYTSPRPAAGSRRRRAAAEEADNRTQARTSRQVGVDDIDGEFCDLSGAAREEQCNGVISALQNLAGTRPANGAQFERRDHSSRGKKKRGILSAVQLPPPRGLSSTSGGRADGLRCMQSDGERCLRSDGAPSHSPRPGGCPPPRGVVPMGC